MFALKISEKIHFFALFLAFLQKFLMIFKKISCHHFSFFARTIPGLECFQGLYLASSAFKDYTKSLTIVLGLGKNNIAAKKKIGAKKAIWKKHFLGFTPKSLPILDFGVQHWNNAKIQPMTKSRNFSKCFIAVYVTFLQFSDTCQKYFESLANFFYSHYFCFKFGRMLQDADVKVRAV